jgi:hypothetical protein
MKQLRVIAGIAIVLLLVVSVVVAYRQPSPLDVAQDYCSEKGFPAETLAVLSHSGSFGLFANRQTVEFRVKGTNPGRRLVVELHQPVYFLPWRPVGLREEALP